MLATVANLLSQELTVQAYQGAYSLYIAIGIGTAVGLVSKYQLDSHYIFSHTLVSARQEMRRFVGYSLTGVVTTLLFWGFELTFDYIFASKAARYTGAAIGLGLGYALKYQLDKRYVFLKQDL